MKRLIILLLAITNVALSQERTPLILESEKHFANIRQLTDGGENAEAYLSFSQSKLSFQSSRNALECDQIFTMNIDGSAITMVSNGKGATTCAYFLPGDSTIIYASTHTADANCPQKPDYSKGYVWKLFDSFEIYKANADGSNIQRLTTTFGYDAEATVSPKGDKIIFTSTRDGDPELYTMNLDGTNQTRLTFEKGYDGGAFFSHDGSKIVFRASRPTTEKDLLDYNDLVKEGLVRPTALEIIVADADGKNITQVTHNGAANFAPYFFPDGKRIIFCSNVNSPNRRNFDLYAINIDGTDFEQITFNESFDGFPMFTNDGKNLIFCSNRHNKKQGETNVFIVDWKP
jgi:Tol biopolymer transport system component